MSDYRLLHSHSQLDVDRDLEEVESDLLPTICDANDITYDQDSKTGLWRGNVVSLLYEWNTEITEEGTVRLHEQVKAPFWLLKTQLGSFWMILASYALLYYVQLQGKISTNNIGVPEALLASVGFFLIVKSLINHSGKDLDLDNAPAPFVDALQDGVGYKRHTSSQLINAFWVLSISILLGLVAMNNQTATGFGGVIHLFIGGGLLLYWASDGGQLYLRILRTSFIGDLRLSGIAKRYAEYALQFVGLLVLLPLATILFKFFVTTYLYSPDQNLLELYRSGIPYPLVILDQVLAIVLLIAGVRTIRNAADEDFLLEYFNFKRRSVTRIGQLVDGAAIVAATGLLYFAIAESLGVFFGIRPSILPDLWVTTPTASFAAAMLCLYFPIGIAYQNYRRSQRIQELIGNSTERTVSTEEFEQSFYLYDSRDLYAASFQTWRESYIVISKGYYETLDTEREFAAIVAHETGHIQNGDTRLCYLISILSTITLVGQNVFYAMVDFQQREQDADKHAKACVGAQPLTNAFVKLAQADPDDYGEAFGISFTPQFDPTDKHHPLHESFHLFFGEFALRAHASYIVRISNLNDPPADG